MDHHTHMHPNDHHASHGHNHADMISDFKRRFRITLVLTIPVMALSPMIQTRLSISPLFEGQNYILLILSSFIFFYGGYPFLLGLYTEIRAKNPGMMTLIGFAISVAYIYSVTIVFGIEGMDFFWELSTLILIMLLGHRIEMKSIA